MHTNATNTKKIILWDLHEVIFERSLLHWLYLGLTYKHKWAVIRSLDWHIISLFIRYLLHVLHIRRAELTSQELIDYAQKKNLHELIELVVLIGSAYTPIPETVAIIHALHEREYTQHIGSNIGTLVLNRCKQLYPSVFAYFCDVYIVHYEQGNLIKKPNPQFFRSYLKTRNLAPDDVLFIDDKFYNIQAAQLCGIETIQFKNPAQLRDILAKNNYF